MNAVLTNRLGDFLLFVFFARTIIFIFLVSVINFLRSSLFFWLSSLMLLLASFTKRAQFPFRDMLCLRVVFLYWWDGRNYNNLDSVPNFIQLQLLGAVRKDYVLEFFSNFSMILAVDIVKEGVSFFHFNWGIPSLFCMWISLFFYLFFDYNFCCWIFSVMFLLKEFIYKFLVDFLAKVYGVKNYKNYK
uniref:Uncharacterized protein n=1 Tax=Parascaris equorum TaxID=6256 RepID=A0A914RJ77_PAREQ